MSIQLYSSPMKYKDPNTGNYTNIIGISGNPGRGITSVELNNDYTLTINFNDNTSITTTSIRGNGIESIEKTSTSGLIDTYTITDSDGNTSTFTVSNGMVPNLTIGTVVEGANAAATITGTSANPVLNLVLPRADVDLSGYATKADTVLETTLSRGRKAESTVGERSFAFGNNVEASGVNSHAEGASTIANGSNAHAEGQSTKAIGKFSHAEGTSTEANGMHSHAEGIFATANGQGSHAEGSATIANGAVSHVEGTYNIADSYDSWPEWVANNSYFVGDTVKVTATEDDNTIVTGYKCITSNSDAVFTTSHWVKDNKMNYVHINGNGTSDVARSNAYALDWDGNGHYMGDVYVGANADSSGGIKLVKETTIAPVETATATAAHAIGDLFMLNGKLLRATAAIAIGDTITVGTNASETKMSEALASAGTVQDVQVNGSSVVSGGVANVPIATHSQRQLGVVKSSSDYGIETLDNGTLYIAQATSARIKEGTNGFYPITPGHQHESAFYALAKAAGVDMASSANAVGTYTEEAKTAIKSMLGVQDGLKVVRLI